MDRITRMLTPTERSRLLSLYADCRDRAIGHRNQYAAAGDTYMAEHCAANAAALDLVVGQIKTAMETIERESAEATT